MMPTHFSKLKKDLKISGWDEGEDTISISREGFKKLLASYVELNTTTFDTAWYLKRYPDIAKSVMSGNLQSAKSHYIQHGYMEGRLPGVKNFDAEDYINRYPDVLSKMGRISRKKRAAAALDHFINFGYKEGREI